MNRGDNKITIRPATSADYSAVVNLLEQLNRLHFESAPDFFKPSPIPDMTQGEFQKILDHERHFSFVALSGSSVCGYLTMEMVPSEDFHRFLISPPRCHVHTVVVDHGHRKCGVANLLLKTAEKKALTLGAKRLTLSVFDFNEPAQQAYLKFGFEFTRLQMTKMLE